jgi:hypothetical protein
MTNNEKKRIITVATELISLLEDCDDMNFVDLVVECVASGDNYSMATASLEEELPY